MSQHTHSVKNIINGVSEQDPTIKLDNQVDEQINLNPDITKGLLKRNPVELLGKFTKFSMKNRVLTSFKYVNNLGVDEFCFLLLPDNNSMNSREHELQVVRLSDNKVFTIYSPYDSNLPSYKSTFIDYFKDANKEDIQVLEDAGSIYFLNKKTKVSMKANPDSDPSNYKAMVWILNADYGMVFSVKVNYNSGSSITYSVATKNLASDPTGEMPYISNLAFHIAGQINSGTLFYAEASNNYFYLLNRGINVINSIEVTDTQSGKMIMSVMNASQFDNSFISNAAFLPNPADDSSFKVRIAPDRTNSELDYILKAIKNAWIESSILAAEIIDEKTFIHKIDKADIALNEESEAFFLKYLGVLTRPAGDINSNKEPTFVNKKINDFFLFNNRLGVAIDDGLVLSKINEYSQFYKTTAAAIRADDRVDVKLDASKLGYSSIKKVSVINTQLIVNTGVSQASLITNTSFDLSKSKLMEISSYTLGNFKPLQKDNFLIYPLFENGHTSFFDFKLNPVTGTSYISEQLNKHCPNYIKGKPIQYINLNNYIIVRTDDDLKTLYIQNNYIVNNQEAQNAFFKWNFGLNVEYISFLNNDVIFIFEKDGNSYFGKMPLSLLSDYDFKKKDYSSFKMELNSSTTGGQFFLSMNGETITVPLSSYSTAGGLQSKLNTFGFLQSGQSFTVTLQTYFKYTITCNGFTPNSPMVFKNDLSNPIIDELGVPSTVGPTTQAYAADYKWVTGNNPTLGNYVKIYDGSSTNFIALFYTTPMLTYRIYQPGKEFDYKEYSAGDAQGFIDGEGHYKMTTTTYTHNATLESVRIIYPTTNIEVTELKINYRPYLDLYSIIPDLDLDSSGLKGVNSITGYEYDSLSDSYSNISLYGVPFESSVLLSKQVLRFQDQRGYTIVHFGNLFLRRFKLLVDNTGTFHVRVKQSFRDDKVQVSNPSQLGLIPLNLINPTNRVFTVYSNGNTNDVSIEVFSDNSQPLNFIGFEWLAILHTRGRRI